MPPRAFVLSIHVLAPKQLERLLQAPWPAGLDRVHLQWPEDDTVESMLETLFKVKAPRWEPVVKMNDKRKYIDHLRPKY